MARVDSLKFDSGLRGKNFLLTILRLAREQPELRVVDDQIGAPTWCRDLASATAQLANETTAGNAQGLYHLTAAGETSWCGFAHEILRASGIDTPVRAITSGEHAAPARRPANSLLSGAMIATRWKLKLPEWRISLASCLRETPESS